MINVKKVTWILIGVISLILLLNFYSTFSIYDLAKDLELVNAELKRPAEIKIITITDTSCADCFLIFTVMDNIKSSNVAVISEEILEYTEDTAQALISQYNIEKVPTIIVTGEINKEGSEISGLTAVDDALILTSIEPVYIETSTGEYRGRVQIETITNSNCEECFDLSEFVDSLTEIMSVTEETSKDLSDASDEVEKYSLTEVPAIIIKGDLELYPELLSSLEALGTYVGKDLILTTKLNPPYWDLDTNKIKGLVDITYITDDSCKDCYNVKIHKTVLEGYGIYINSETTIDISSKEGLDLLKEYNITKVPTIIASEDMQYYDGINKVWDQVGTIDQDGNYIFRKLNLVSDKYTDLE